MASPVPTGPARGARVAWSLAIACFVLAAITIVLLVVDSGRTPFGGETGNGALATLSFLVAFLTFATTGALLVDRVAGNPIGPIFCSIGVLGAIGICSGQVAGYSNVSTGALPGAATFAWLGNFAPSPAVGLLALSLLLFPDGHVPSRRWRPVLILAWAGVAFIVVSYILLPGRLDPPFEAFDNPMGIAGLDAPMGVLKGLGWLLMSICVGLAGIATTNRLRRSTGSRRQQLKWIALAAALVGLVLVLNMATYFLAIDGIEEVRSAVVAFAFAGFPVAAAIAILRYRLYDIDVVINRALVYTSLTAMLATTYLASILLLQLVLSGITADNGLAIAGSTLAVAALFQPLRARVQVAVDRRFFRRRYDAVRTLQDFGARLRDEVDLDTLAGELRAVVSDTMQPAHVSLWLRQR